jgi:hypothetical protein
MSANFVVAILASPNDPHRHALEEELQRRTKSLARAGESIAFVDPDNITSLKEASPDRAVAAVLCSGEFSKKATKIVADWQDARIPIFPVVEDLKRFPQLAPESLRGANGFEWRRDEDVGELAGLLLEALGLQRGRRKLFISYARMDSAAMADQLRSAFVGRWYTVFHDTVSIRPGRDFQEELKHELADSDVILLLNSPSIATRPYVQEEIAFANEAGVNGVQLIWPNVQPRRDALFTRVDLAKEDYLRAGRLTPIGIAEVLRSVAEARTAMQEARETQLFRLVEAYANSKKWRAVVHPGRFIQLRGPGKKSLTLPFILGAPTSMELQGPCAAIERGVAAQIAYDRLGLSQRHRKHLDFLAERLPITFLDYRTALKWRIIA